jgi:uncharacterized membrane protein
MDFWQLLGNLHPKLVQFPLVLLLAGLIFDAAGLFKRSANCHWAARILSSAGTFFLLVAFICGIYAEIWAGRAGIPQEQIEWHELMANIASWGFVVLMAFRLFLEPAQRKAMIAYTVIGLSWYSLLVITGYLGGRLVFDYGAAVVGARSDAIPALHDLNVLATRQTDLNLRYSEMMHHIFGWLTLALSGSLFVNAVFPKKSEKAKWVGPALLMFGGIFLFFCADLDLYKFTDLRQLRDREVQLHKTLAIILTVVGGSAIWRMRKGAKASEPENQQQGKNRFARAGDNGGNGANGNGANGGESHSPKFDAVQSSAIASVAIKTDDPESNGGFSERWKRDRYTASGIAGAEPVLAQDSKDAGAVLVAERSSPKPAPAATKSGSLTTPSKVVAVMALIGGGMLFTHVHTVAPYANVAAGVYINHVVLGLVALGIGGTRLLQDSWPKRRHLLAFCFAVLMCVESVLLIGYNEGLPWFIGYGNYNRWGNPDLPLAGTIAPYGAFRAELTFDNATSKMDLYVWDRFNNTPHPVDTQNVTVQISRGYQESGIMLAADPSDMGASNANDANGAAGTGGVSHFSAIVPSMQGVVAFSARAALPYGDSTRMGYFDPWVTPIVHPIPPNEVAKYQCPMHEGVLSETPGKCPLCGMPMILIQTTPRMVLHDDGYDMQFSIDGHAATMTAGKEGIFKFVPTQNGQMLRDLAIVHEHLMHLIVVSADLSFFDHVHPVIQPDGSFLLPYTFAKPGSYLLFSDITPVGQRNQVFRIPVRVAPADGNPELLMASEPIVPSTTFSKPLAADPSITAELLFQPRTPQTGIHNDFVFRLTKDGQPLTDLQPYIGAMGHCVIISQDTQMYLHCHPEQLLAPSPDARGGPTIAFHTIFPHAGIYKIWGQFRRGDQILVADFVVEVKDPLLPPKMINFLLDD